MRILWAMVLGIALTVPTLVVADHRPFHTLLDVFQRIKQPRKFFTARVHKVEPHFEDAEGRFAGTPHVMNGEIDEGAWVFTPSHRLVQVTKFGFAEKFLFYTNSTCADSADSPRISESTVNVSAGGFLPPNVVNNSIVWEATGPAALSTVASVRVTRFIGEFVCVPAPLPHSAIVSFPAVAVETLPDALPFTLE